MEKFDFENFIFRLIGSTGYGFVSTDQIPENTYPTVTIPGNVMPALFEGLAHNLDLVHKSWSADSQSRDIVNGSAMVFTMHRLVISMHKVLPSRSGLSNITRSTWVRLKNHKWNDALTLIETVRPQYGVFAHTEEFLFSESLAMFEDKSVQFFATRNELPHLVQAIIARLVIAKPTNMETVQAQPGDLNHHEVVTAIRLLGLLLNVFDSFIESLIPYNDFHRDLTIGAIDEANKVHQHIMLNQ